MLYFVILFDFCDFCFLLSKCDLFKCIYIIFGGFWLRKVVVYFRILLKFFLLINNFVYLLLVMVVGIFIFFSLLDINILIVIFKVDRIWSERFGFLKCINKEFNLDKVIIFWFLIIYM